MTNRERQVVSALVIEMAREDPDFVLEVIRKLKRSGEIGADDLAHVERVARRWVRIAHGRSEEGTTLSRGGSFTPFAFARSRAS